MTTPVPEYDEDWEFIEGKLTSTSKFLVRESHLDVFGHINNATYLKLFEEARWDLLNSRDYPISVIRELHQGPVILEANVKFRREVLNRETITIDSYVLPYDGVIGRLRQKLRNGQGKLAAEALFKIGLWDTNERKLILPTQRWLEVLGLDGKAPGL